MSTGDLNCNVGRLRSVLRDLRYTYAASLPEDRLRDGDPSVLLPVLHYCLLGYSTKLAKLISQKGFELQAKTDERFVEHCWRFLREHFNFMPQLNRQQFLSKGFAERKLILVTDVAKLCKQQHAQLSRKEKLQTKRIPKDAHLESVFPPVNKKEEREASHNIAKPATPPIVLYEHNSSNTKKNALTTIHKQIQLTGEGEGEAEAEAAASVEKRIAKAEEDSEIYTEDASVSDEYDYSSSYDDDEDDDQGREGSSEEEEEEEEELNGFKQSPVDFSKQSGPSFERTLNGNAFEQRKIDMSMLPPSVSGNVNVTPSKAQMYFNQVVKEDSSTHDIARAFPLLVQRNKSNHHHSHHPNVDADAECQASGTARRKLNAEEEQNRENGTFALTETHANHLKDQVSALACKLDLFQENITAKFLLLEGRVRYLEGVFRKHVVEKPQEKQSKTPIPATTTTSAAKTFLREDQRTNGASTSRVLDAERKEESKSNGKLTAVGAATSTNKETSSFISQVEGRCKETQLLLESLAS